MWVIRWRTGWRCIADDIGWRYYGSSGELVEKHIQAQIIYALRSGERTRASSMLVHLGQGNQSAKADDFLQILDYCAKSPDPLFALETARFLDEKEIRMSNTCQLLTLQALCNGGYLEEGYRMLQHLGEHHKMHPSLAAYNCLLKACVDSKSPILTNNCLDLMDRRMVGKNEATYLELLKIALWQKNLSVAHQIWKDYNKHYSLSSLSLRKFIWAFSRLGDLKSAFETLQMMVALAISGALRSPARGRLSSSRLDIPIPSKSESILDRFSESKMKNRSGQAPSYGNDWQLNCSTISNIEVCSSSLCTPRSEALPISMELRWSFNDILHSCAKDRNGILADKLLQQMHNLGLQPSSYTYDGYIRAIIPERGYRDALGVLKLMQKQNLKPHDSTLAAVAISCSNALELDLAEKLLGRISGSPHPYPINACLTACNALNQPERAVRLLAKMKQINVHPDVTTYALLFSLFGNVNYPYEVGDMSHAEAVKRISAIETDMAKRGVQHNLLSMRNLIRVLGQEGMMKELIHHLHVAENIDISSDFHLVMPVYNTVLHSLVEAKESDKAIDIFKNIRSSPCPPDAETYNIMIDCCSILKCFRSACALVALMVRSGCLPVTTTFTILMKILLEDENYDEAFHLLAQARSEGMLLDVLFFNTIIKKLCEKGEIVVLEHIIELMHRENVPPDPSTCSHVFAAYVDNGYTRTAMQALEVLSMRMISQDGSIPEDRRSKYDEFILSEDPKAESKLTPFYKDNDDSLAFALLNLRWCAIEGMPRNWSPEQSPWAQRLRIKYDQEKRKIDQCNTTSSSPSPDGSPTSIGGRPSSSSLPTPTTPLPLLRLRTLPSFSSSPSATIPLNRSRIAVCLVGGARRFELTGPSIIRGVLNVYPNADLFLHSPLDENSYKFAILNRAPRIASVRIFKPAGINETEPALRVLTARNSPNGIQGLLQYFNLVEGCLTLIKAHQSRHSLTYDWIIRTRVDGYWNGPLSPDNFIPGTYVVPPGSTYGGLNDRLGIGDLLTSTVALSRLSLVPLLDSSGYRQLNSETAFCAQLTTNKIPYVTPRLPFCIISNRRYEFPPNHFGVPVAAMSSKGPLSGAKCRPCKPVCRDKCVEDMMSTLENGWSWTNWENGTLELCNAHGEWEKGWEEVFDEAVGQKLAKVRRKVKRLRFKGCVREFVQLRRSSENWEAPNGEEICRLGCLGRKAKAV